MSAAYDLDQSGEPYRIGGRACTKKAYDLEREKRARQSANRAATRAATVEELPQSLQGYANEIRSRGFNPTAALRSAIDEGIEKGKMLARGEAASLSQALPKGLTAQDVADLKAAGLTDEDIGKNGPK